MAIQIFLETKESANRNKKKCPPEFRMYLNEKYGRDWPTKTNQVTESYSVSFK